MTQVVDASVIVAALADEGDLGAWAEARLPEFSLAAPALMAFEVANILRRTEARGAIDRSFAAQALRDLRRLDIEEIPFELLADRAWELRNNLTFYDASYVAAAELLDARLLSLDLKLAKATGPRCEILTAP